ncbi:MAG TPA: histidine kinase [Acidobacteriota bacterium]|jgi:sensor histidine kinase YesM
MQRQRWGRWALFIGCWTLLGIFFASQLYLSYAYSRYPIRWGQALALELTAWYIWAALSPAILWLARHFRIERSRWVRSLLVHIPASLIFTFVKLNLEIWVIGHIRWLPPRRIYPSSIHPNILTYWAIVGISHALDYYRRYRERELKASQLEAKLAQSQLQVLKMQLHPHFFFNTLHAISTLMHRDVEIADRMLARLSDLLRLTLENAGMQEVPLKEELAFLDPYLEIEQARFGDRLCVQLDIQPDTLGALVPNLLLQPLVENAIRHGIAQRAEGGRIWIMAMRKGEKLMVQIRDNGAGIPAELKDLKERVGLMNTRARLQQLYGAAHRFDLRNAPDGGLEVTLEMPFLTEDGHA